MNNRPESDLIEYVQLRAEWATLADRTETLKKKLDTGVESAKSFEEIAALRLVEQEYLRALALSDAVAAANLPKLKVLYDKLSAVEKLNVAHYDKLRITEHQSISPAKSLPLSVSTTLGLFVQGGIPFTFTDQEDQHIVSETNTFTCPNP